MRRIRNFWRNIYDVRPGEKLRALFMFSYLLLVLFAYYILKPVSQAMFLNKFDAEDLPFLIILIAIGGGILAYVYSRVAVKTSLARAVTWTMAIAVVCLVIIWWLLAQNLPWMLYVLNIFVGLFSIVLVAQGWLVAGNVFTPREAKRIYSLLGMSMVVGAAFGGEFTRRTAVLIGTRNLLLASAGLVVLAYAAFLGAAAQKGVALSAARGATDEETEFSVRDIARDIGRIRHLQVIVAMMAMTFIVDVLVNYQFQAMAKTHYRGDQLTVFLGSFYGLYLNLTEFVVQFLLTSLVVSRFGVGGTLQVMPVSILLASIATAAAPAVASTSAVRLTEACTRYTLNKTGMELLYMPLPIELRNRIKAFIDIFFDRMSRGAGGLILILCTKVLHFNVRQIAMVVIGVAIPWIWISLRASREYVATIRNRLAARRLDLESARVTVNDRETVRLLEETVAGGKPRQAAYALGLLAEAPGYDLAARLREQSSSPHPEVRAKVLELARQGGFAELQVAAQHELRRYEAGAAVDPAVAYLIAVSPGREGTAREFLDSPDPRIAAAAIRALDADTAPRVITQEWIAKNSGDRNPARRALAADAIGARRDHQGTEVLQHLLRDSDPAVVTAACRAAGALRNRAHFFSLVDLLSNPRVRGAAIAGLAQYGAQICGALGDLLDDRMLPAVVRRQVTRVLRAIPAQRSVDVLLNALSQDDLAMRSPALKALNRLRETSPQLKFEDAFVTRQIHEEARRYFELAAALEPFRQRDRAPRTAVDLLARTLEERLRQTLERLFRLLGLRYPPAEIYSSYLAVSRSRVEQAAAALDFLDTILERDLKRILLPLLDAPEHLAERGRDLFGVEVPDAQTALRELIRSHDPWLAACAMAAAAEMRLRNLAPDISQAANGSEPELDAVARSAQSVLA